VTYHPDIPSNAVRYSSRCLRDIGYLLSPGQDVRGYPPFVAEATTLGRWLETIRIEPKVEIPEGPEESWMLLTGLGSI
jgi:hypothetical protein